MSPDSLGGVGPGGTTQHQALIDAEAIVIEGEAGESRFRSMLDALPAAAYTTDASGRLTYYNRAAARLAGREPRIGTDEWCVSWRLYRPDGSPLPHDRCPMALAIAENRAVRGLEAMLERPDGTRVSFAPYPTPLHDATGALVGAVNLLVEIGDRSLAESPEAYLAAIVESSDDAIISKNLNGVVTSWNRGAELIFGYRPDEMIGKPISLLFPVGRLTEEDLILEKIRGGDRVDHFETVRRRKDGREINVSLTISPVRDDHGRIIGVSKIARDITQQKRTERTLRDLNEGLEKRVLERTRELAQVNERLMTEIAERERTEAVLLQAQKMEAVGQLASGLAHDFNNLLAAVLGNLELLEMRLTDERLLRLTHAAARSARRGATLNEQLLAFSRKQHLAPKPVDVNVLVTGMDELLGRSLGGTVKIASAVAPDLWPALVDPHQLELVLLNLAINARDAMPQGGQVLIETANVRAGDLRGAVDMAPGDYVRIAVSDTGMGMSPEVLERACEPFFTTKELGKGSGLGLAQVYGVARQSGGGLQIKSVEGEGTTIELYLPRSLETVAPVTDLHNRQVPAALNQRLRVLVVDDHEEVRDVIVTYLGDLGYDVVQAANGRMALELLSGPAGAVDVMIADYAMPEMSGVELARAVRVRYPALPVVIVTGYAEAAGFDDRNLDVGLLKKPFRMNELGAAVEFALSHGPGALADATVIPLKSAKRR